MPDCTLIVHTGGIGDFLLALPAIEQIAKESTVELAGYCDRLELAVDAGIAARAHSLDTVQFHTVFDQPSDSLRKFASKFDRAIVFMRDPEGTIHDGLFDCGIRHVETHAGLPDAEWTRHASQYYAQCLGVTLSDDFRLAVTPAGEPLDVVIHPGSGSPKKNWPLANFVDLAESLREAGRRVTWCLGPAESDRFPILSKDMLHCDSLVELAPRLATARRYIGNDSGITHLAAVIGVPTTAIFGPTDPHVWAPKGEHVVVAVAEQGAGWPDVETLIRML